MPKGFKGGKISSVTSSKNPLLFLNKKFSSDKGYAPGLLCPPTNKSRSPSKSKSTERTIQPLEFKLGSLFF